MQVHPRGRRARRRRARADELSADDRSLHAARLRSATGVGPYLEFVRVTPDATPVWTRVHLDLLPYPGDDQAAEAARLKTLGATPADVGQGDVSWVVLADPEGNEFCVLRPAGLGGN